MWPRSWFDVCVRSPHSAPASPPHTTVPDSCSKYSRTVLSPGSSPQCHASRPDSTPKSVLPPTLRSKRVSVQEGGRVGREGDGLHRDAVGGRARNGSTSTSPENAPPRPPATIPATSEGRSPSPPARTKGPSPSWWSETRTGSRTRRFVSTSMARWMDAGITDGQDHRHHSDDDTPPPHARGSKMDRSAWRQGRGGGRGGLMRAG